MKDRILLIEDEEDIRIVYAAILQHIGYDVSTAGDYDEAMRRISNNKIDLIFSDIVLGNKTGIDLLREVKEKGLTCPVIMITGDPSVETAAESVRLGAYDYLLKPVSEDALRRVSTMALRLKHLSDRYDTTRKNLEAIFQSVKDAIITVDTNLNILELNEAASDLCGLDQKDIGRPIGPHIKYCGRKCLDAIRSTVNEKSRIEMQHVECEHTDRPHQVVNINTYPLTTGLNTVSGAVVVIRDETRLVNLERDLNERGKFHNIIGKSEVMQKIYTFIEDLADIESTVLITGQSGTGKELVAEALHYTGIRGANPLVKVNCSALSEQLLESELFGHVKGAFTGAIKDKIGKFEFADGGTLFLDEIGDLSPTVQVKLLRFLQSKEFEKVGSTDSIKVDVRLVAATNRNIEDLITRNEFREDLYYRLSVIDIHLPALKERVEDIPLLTEYFLARLSKRLNKNLSSVTQDVMMMFMEYSWPGNVRELQHTLEHAFVLTRNDIISVKDLSPRFISQVEKEKKKPIVSPSAERLKIVHALDRVGWNKAKAARLLDISRTTLYHKIEEYSIYESNT